MNDLYLISALVSKGHTIGHRASIKRAGINDEAMGALTLQLTSAGYSVDSIDCVKLELDWVAE